MNPWNIDHVATWTFKKAFYPHKNPIPTKCINDYLILDIGHFAIFCGGKPFYNLSLITPGGRVSLSVFVNSSLY